MSDPGEDARPHAGSHSPSAAAPRPYNLVAELTYRCPLRCPYCSNPTALGAFPEKLSAADWGRVFGEAAELGVVHVGLTGGEPTTRRDLVEIIGFASQADLYTHLVTAGIPLEPAGLGELRDAGLRSVQLSIQDTQAADSDALAGTECFEKKLAFARETRRIGLPLTLNVVLHRRNLARVPEIIELARALDADRLELANVQYLGWALTNRDALLPSSRELESARRLARAAGEQRARPEILFVLPDYFRNRPKPCTGGWGRRHMVITPDGRVLPCHGAAELPLVFWNVCDENLARCWQDAPGMNTFRGTDWMPEPCRSCPERDKDFGGCRCQAFALTGDASATDPACELSPHHSLIEQVRSAAEETRDDGSPFVYRQMDRQPR